jgi:cytochrome P450
LRTFPFSGLTDLPFPPLPTSPGAPVRVELPTGTPAWLVTRHADVRELLRHPSFSADLSRPGFPLLRPLLAGEKRQQRATFIRMDGAEHARFRKMLTAEFMIKNIRRIEPLIADTVDEALTDLLAVGPPADLIEHFALPVPSKVICHLLGVPYADHAFFQAHSRTILDRTADQDAVRAALDALRGYLHELIAAKGSDDDLLSRLVVERVRTEEITVSELVSMALLLLVAGHETTANMIGLSTVVLLSHPPYLAALRADPGVAPDLVEELLRYLTIVRTGLPRVAVDDVLIGGQLIRAGEGAIALLTVANLDDAVFPGPRRSSCAARRTSTWRSGSGCTNASASRWRAPSCGSPSCLWCPGSRT